MADVKLFEILSSGSLKFAFSFYCYRGAELPGCPQAFCLWLCEWAIGPWSCEVFWMVEGLCLNLQHLLPSLTLVIVDAQEASVILTLPVLWLSWPNPQPSSLTPQISVCSFLLLPLLLCIMFFTQNNHDFFKNCKERKRQRNIKKDGQRNLIHFPKPRNWECAPHFSYWNNVYPIEPWLAACQDACWQGPGRGSRAWTGTQEHLRGILWKLFPAVNYPVPSLGNKSAGLQAFTFAIYSIRNTLP